MRATLLSWELRSRWVIVGRSALLAAAAACLVACASSLESPAGVGGSEPAAGSFADGSGQGFGDDLSNGGGLDRNSACVGQTAGAEISATVLQLVVDTSGSMDDDAPGRVQGSKWEATRSAVLNAIDQMPATTAVGVLFYPDRMDDDDDDDDDDEAGSCLDRQADVPLRALAAPGSQHRSQIRNAFENQDPEGGTPTHDAYAFGLQGLESVSLPGARFVVLITDGIPTFSSGCDDSGRNDDGAVDPSPLVPAAAQALERGTRTFVIGSPGSDGARESLSRMAEAGGTGIPGCSHAGPTYCHFDMTETQDFARALAEALGQIAGLALSCSYDIPSAPDGAELDLAKVNVLFSAAGQDQLIAQSPGPGCTQGWQYSPDGTQVVLCGATCDQVRAADGNLTLLFGCATTIR